jgi:hypothetical protein
VVEGCYTRLTKIVLDYRPLLLFINPGQAQCIDNCRSRPWEPYKYASKQEQDERLEPLLTRVADYYTRSGDLSLGERRACFDSYSGPKQEIKGPLQLAPPSEEVLAWVDQRPTAGSSLL